MAAQIQEENVISKVKQEVNVISNIPFIFEKIESEGFYKPIYDSLESLLNNEIIFALGHLLSEEALPEMNELKRQLVSNSYIFKENLKIICSLVSLLKSGVHLEGKGAPRQPGQTDPSTNVSHSQK
jgi:hypothetical protein